MGQVITSIGIESYDRQNGIEKAKNVAIHQDWRTICNALVICVFANVPVETVLDLVNAACGLQLSISELMELGERAWNLKRVINIRLGLRRSNDKLPEALLQPYKDNPEGAAGYVPDFESMLTAYYDSRGWNQHTGYPSKDKLKYLGLGWLVEDKW
jgi:aldehyde:ferredoxin oxidoreductase